MASVFTYDPDPPRVSSPWSTSGSSTPQALGTLGMAIRSGTTDTRTSSDSDQLADYGITKLDAEPQEGPTEYKLHLLLRPRRLYTSMSTGHLVSGSYHSRSSLSTSSPIQTSSETSAKSIQRPPSHTRQQRLQQLTTQLLWRLQQSSPFHSTSTANLILPVLPEATPKLGVPKKPARLVSGLEESQGALYEIGVADNGIFVGLADDELDESLNNLRAMAASLGCKVDILRKVVVGKCEWAEESNSKESGSIKIHSDHLWVAEALISPDLEYYALQSSEELQSNLKHLKITSSKEAAVETSGYSKTGQIRVSIAGPSSSGKSSLLGTLTTSTLDNGRGKSRLSLLKHRHEISSGITSSVAQELIGYSSATSSGSDRSVVVVNYASGNVTSWNDIHTAASGGRLAFISDLPGLPRYMKSTLRGLLSWAPHYIILCIPANSCESDETQGASEHASEIEVCLSYLELCMKLEVPILLAISKLDLASRSGLKLTLTKVLSAIKLAGKRPLMLSVTMETPEQTVDHQTLAAADCEEVRKAISVTNMDWSHTTPIIFTSAVNGSGIGKLHAFLRYIPLPKSPPSRNPSPHSMLHPQRPNLDVFDIDEVFTMPPCKVYTSTDSRHDHMGIVLCGLVRHGSISIGDELMLGPSLVDPQTNDGNVHQASRPRLLPGVDNANNFSPHNRRVRSQPSGEFSMSLAQGLPFGNARHPVHAEWQQVRVVSVRNLRLPVRTLLEDQVGTVGIEAILSGTENGSPNLGRVRKGMVLCKSRRSSQGNPSIATTRTLSFSVGFTAAFSAHEFSSPLSPPLILGGHAIIYTANIRAAVKVTCVALADNDVVSAPPSPVEPDFFSFDGDDIDSGNPDHNSGRHAGAEGERPIRVSTDSAQDIKITFVFISSIEWIEVGYPVIIMPGAMTTPSVSGESAMLPGFGGFVGRVSEVLTSDLARQNK